MADIYTTLKVKTNEGYDNIYPRNNSTITHLTPISVSVDTWEENTVKTNPFAPNYPYRAKVKVPNMNSNYIPIVSFSKESLDLNILAPITMSIDGGIEIYAEQKSDTNITIESILGVMEIKEE